MTLNTSPNVILALKELITAASTLNLLTKERASHKNYDKIEKIPKDRVSYLPISSSKVKIK